MKRIFKPFNLLLLMILAAAIIAFQFLPMDEILATLRSLTLLEGLVIGVINALILLLFNARWWIILSTYHYRLPYLKLSAYRTVGFAISYFSPGTQFGGEPLLAYLVQSRHQVPGTVSVAAVALDKSIELFANFTFLILGIALTLGFGLINNIAQPGLIIGAGVFLLFPFIYWLTLRLGKFPLSAMSRRLPSKFLFHPILTKLPDFITETEMQVALIFRNRPWLIVWMFFISALVWLLMILEYGLMAYFLGARLDVLQTVAGYTASRIAFLAPIPGSVGLLEASQAMAMKSFGYTSALGISLSLLMRARDLVVGLFGLWVGALIGVKKIKLPAKSWSSAPAEPDMSQAGN